MTEERRSPLVAQVILFVAFLAIAVIGAFTVVIPELTSDEARDEDAPAATPVEDAPAEASPPAPAP